jgi:hypothetical protein
MYVDLDRGFCVVAFHFDPALHSALVDECGDSGVELCSRLLAGSEPVAGEIILPPDAVHRGAVNIFNVLHRISVIVVESMRHWESVQQNDGGNGAAEKNL